MSVIKRCHNCPKRRAVYRCVKCEASCCEHRCGNKHEDTKRPGRYAAVCGSCRLSARGL